MSGNQTTMYITPNNGSLYAINTPAMSAKWSIAYSPVASNTGAAYVTIYRDTVYTAAGNNVYKIADQGAGSVFQTWSFPASSLVNTGPIWNGATVYFGCNGGNYYAINDATGLARANWPRATGNGNATCGPWIDAIGNAVIYGTTSGNLDAFTLEP